MCVSGEFVPWCYERCTTGLNTRWSQEELPFIIVLIWRQLNVLMQQVAWHGKSQCSTVNQHIINVLMINDNRYAKTIYQLGLTLVISKHKQILGSIHSPLLLPHGLLRKIPYPLAAKPPLCSSFLTLSAICCWVDSVLWICQSLFLMYQRQRSTAIWNPAGIKAKRQNVQNWKD